MPTDASLAAEIAAEAGRALLGLRSQFGDDRLGDPSPRPDGCRRRAGPAPPVRPADRGAAAGRRALGGGRRTRMRGCSADRVWIIDPLDGTNEYGQGRTDFAVHVALWQRGAGPDGGLTDAVVDVPALGEIWRTDEPRLVAGAPEQPRAADGGLPVAPAGRPGPAAGGRLGGPGRRGDHRPGHRGGQRGVGRGQARRGHGRAGPRPTCIPADSTSGTSPRRWPARGPRGSSPSAPSSPSTGCPRRPGRPHLPPRPGPDLHDQLALSPWHRPQPSHESPRAARNLRSARGGCATCAEIPSGDGWENGDDYGSLRTSGRAAHGPGLRARGPALRVRTARSSHPTPRSPSSPPA